MAFARLLLVAAVGTLDVTSGPPELLGLQLQTARLRFGPERFTVEAEAVFTSPRNWSLSTCPPVFQGSPSSLSGRLVVVADPSPRKCSHQNYARAVLAAGGIAVLMWMSNDVIFDPTPGYNDYWVLGDERVEPPTIPAVAFTSRAAMPVVNAIKAGQSLRLRLTPDVSAWERLWRSPLWLAWQAFHVLYALATVELALCHLVAVGRIFGHRPQTIAHALLWLEVLLSALRAAYFVDPYASHNLYELHVSFLLLYLPVVLATIASALLLIYFAQAASADGLPSFRLTHRPARAVLTALVMANLLIFVALELFAASTTLALFKMLMISIFFPLFVLVLSAFTERSVRKLLGSMQDLPAEVVQRIAYRIRIAIRFTLLQVLIALPVVWASFSPMRLLVVWGAYTVVANEVATAQVLAFRPVGSWVPRLPLRIAREALLRRLLVPLFTRCAACVPRLASRASSGKPQKVQKVLRSARELLGGGRESTASRTSRRWSLPSLVGAPPRIHPGDPSADSAELAHTLTTTKAPAAHLLLGVSFRFLLDFCERHGMDETATTYDVSSIVCSVTEGTNRSICELEATSLSQDGRHAISEATIFISHAQACSFHKLIDAIDNYCEVYGETRETAYFWIDIFCIRQHRVAADVPFIGMIEAHVGKVVIVVDPWNHPVCLTRVWCLYEIVQCRLQGNLELRIAMSRAERIEFVRALARDRASVEKALISFDSRTATASVEADKLMIFSLITQGFGGVADGDSVGTDAAVQARAFENFNSTVRSLVKGALTLASWQVGFEKPRTARECSQATTSTTTSRSVTSVDSSRCGSSRAPSSYTFA